ncbi:DUF748 domain-containing protein [Paraburkholderia sp. BL10I2N1]|uniref:DUF748 domain-containing protein n=1 Tax=Paraburkholderia sp. BL10I2N1 TaxID=1938796 RepID=UPI00105C0BB5|nr:DUF748 domain-containing protein [Paraburkholderia sp. BL10I2N1]TDN67723.1 uncharacterized protein DUF748 [Paraburkholderia sp. BL10I2N1]
MALSKGGRVAVAVAGVVAALIVAALAGLYFVQHEVKERVIQALGPLGSADSIDVGLTSVRLTNVRLKPPEGWPAGDPLHADEITVTPDVHELIQRRVHLRSVVISGFTLTVVRTPDGKLKLLPNLRESLSSPSSTGPNTASSTEKTPLPPEKLFDHIEFRQGTFVFYDFEVSKPAYKIIVSDANASINHIHLPDLNEPTTVAVNGSIKGPAHTGKVSFDGWIKIARKDSQTTTTLRGVDIKTLDPYLLKKARSRVSATHC